MVNYPLLYCPTGSSHEASVQPSVTDSVGDGSTISSVSEVATDLSELDAPLQQLQQQRVGTPGEDDRSATDVGLRHRAS